MAPEAPTFYLTNGTDRPPIVHGVFVPSTSTWQYIVACPSTLHCIILDPVRDQCADRATISTDAASDLIALVRKESYLCDLILETNASRTTQTASWYLRRQLNEIQGWPPQVCRDATAVTTVEALWQRKYGTSSPFAASLRDTLGDGESILVGRMRVLCMNVQSFGTTTRRAYIVGNTVFGAHDIATLARSSISSDAFDSMHSPNAVDRERCEHTWSAMQRVLSLPEETRVYFDEGGAVASGVEPYDHLHYCRAVNEYVGLSKSDFITRRQGEWQSWQQQQEQAQRPKYSRRTRRHG